MLDPAITQKVLQRVRQAERRAEDEAFATLTEQEMRILSLLAEGKKNKEIAEDIFLSEKTVRNYVSSILSKLNFVHPLRSRCICGQTQCGQPPTRRLILF